MLRAILTPVLVTVLTVSAMLFQARTVDPVLCEAPDVRLPDLAGFEAESVPVSEAELRVLPPDTQFDKRFYKSPDGCWFLATAVIGGRYKNSVHRPELCLPSQGFQMSEPRAVQVGGIGWHCVTLRQGGAQPMGFAYTFFNQDGFRTSSHLARIFRDVWDRSVRCRIDRWVMLTVHSNVSDDARLADFLDRLKGVVK